MAILDADKEGFLRSETSLIQIIGRAARNVDGQVIMYADKVDRLDAAGHQRDQPSARPPIPLQRRARDRSPDHPQEGLGHPRADIDRSAGRRPAAQGADLPTAPQSRRRRPGPA